VKFLVRGVHGRDFWAYVLTASVGYALAQPTEACFPQGRLYAPTENRTMTGDLICNPKKPGFWAGARSKLPERSSVSEPIIFYIIILWIPNHTGAD